jgi:hypothetical protein
MTITPSHVKRHPSFVTGAIEMTTTATSGNGNKTASEIAGQQPMKSINKPANVNIIGLARPDYKGLESTLCNGCGHDSISAQIITA